MCTAESLNKKNKRTESQCFLEWNLGITVLEDSDVAQRKARGGYQGSSKFMVNSCILLDYIQKMNVLQRRMNLNKVSLIQVLILGSAEYKTEPVFQGAGHFLEKFISLCLLALL